MPRGARRSTDVARILIRHVAFNEDGVSIDYMTLPGDARENGLALTHNVWIPREDDYDDEIDAIEQAAQEAVLDALDDFKKLPELDLEKQVQEALTAAAEAEQEDEDTPTGEKD